MLLTPKARDRHVDPSEPDENFKEADFGFGVRTQWSPTASPWNYTFDSVTKPYSD